MVLICYDGSPDAQEAVRRAGELLAGQPATVLTVWEPYADVLAYPPAYAPGGFMLPAETILEIDRAAEEAALRHAEQGADLARQVGFPDAEPRSRRSDGRLADAILEEAEHVGARAIVLGTRGLTGIRSALLGSVSHAVLQHADRAVLVVPSPEIAERRRRDRDRA
jgi:nucleotide-binding universal stress UspA family protein